MKLRGNKILITGGASGIGLGFTEQFLKDDNQVIICGRRKDVLEDIKKRFPEVITKACDLEQEEERVNLFEWIKNEHADLNVLVNNAGIQQWTNLTDAGFYNKAKQEIAINIVAPIHLTSLFIQLQSLTTILNVTSGLAFVPLTKVPVYSATKAFFHSFTLSAQHLLKSRNIEVIEIVPPALNTDLGGKGLHDVHPPVSEFIKAVFDQLREGKLCATFGFSDMMSKAGPDQLKQAFDRMNPV